MSAFRLSKSQRPKLSSFDLLHNGIKRTVDKQQYTKIFTKIKINTKIRNTHFVNNTSRQTLQNLQKQREKLKHNIRMIEAENKELQGKISKVDKLENILYKKVESQNIYDLSLQKALEIKLLLQCETVEEEHQEKQEQFNRVFKQQKEKQQLMEVYEDQAQVQLHAILYDNSSSVAKAIRQKESRIQQCHHILTKTREKIHKMKQLKKSKKQQVKQVDKCILLSKSSLPSNHKITDQNDSAIYGTQNRGKPTTDSLEKEIQKLHQDNAQSHHQIQELTETKIKEKIQILKAIDQLQNLIICQNVTSKKGANKVIF